MFEVWEARGKTHFGAAGLQAEKEHFKLCRIVDVYQFAHADG